MNKQQLISRLQLEAHPEGGYFRRTYTATQLSSAGERPCMSSIFYLLTDDSPVGHLHRNRSDIVHYWQGGSPLNYLLLSPDGKLTELTLGPELDRDQQLQLTVPGGYWKASHLAEGEYGLISEAVCPGFSFDDHAMAGPELLNQYPEFREKLAFYIASR